MQARVQCASTVARAAQLDNILSLLRNLEKAGDKTIDTVTANIVNFSAVLIEQSTASTKSIAVRKTVNVITGVSMILSPALLDQVIFIVSLIAGLGTW